MRPPPRRASPLVPAQATRPAAVQAAPPWAASSLCPRTRRSTTAPPRPRRRPPFKLRAQGSPTPRPCAPAGPGAPNPAPRRIPARPTWSRRTRSLRLRLPAWPPKRPPTKGTLNPGRRISRLQPLSSHCVCLKVTSRHNKG